MLTHSARTSRRPASTSARSSDASRPARSMSLRWSRHPVCDTTRTESLLRPDSSPATRTLPGASPSRRLVVNGTHSTERILLRLKLSAWTIRTGRRNPGSLPNGTPRSAYQISPRVMFRQLAPTLQSHKTGTGRRRVWQVTVGYVQALGHVLLLTSKYSSSAIATNWLRATPSSAAALCAFLSNESGNDTTVFTASVLPQKSQRGAAADTLCRLCLPSGRGQR